MLHGTYSFNLDSDPDPNADVHGASSATQKFDLQKTVLR